MQGCLSTTGLVLQMTSPSKHCDSQSHVCTFPSRPHPSLKWTMNLLLCGLHGHSGHRLDSFQLSANAPHCQQKGWSHQRLSPVLMKVLKAQNYSTSTFLVTRTLRDQLSTLSYAFLKSVLSSPSNFSLPLLRLSLPSTPLDRHHLLKRQSAFNHPPH